MTYESKNAPEPKRRGMAGKSVITSLHWLFRFDVEYLREGERQHCVQPHVGNDQFLVVRIEGYAARLLHYIRRLAVDTPARCHVSVVVDAPDADEGVFWLGNAAVLGLGIAWHPEAAANIDQLPIWLNRTAALIAIARHAGGSVRDSLSLLEQVSALGGGRVDEPGVRRALGLAGSEAFMMLASAVASQEAKQALELVAELAGDGVDLRRFVSESIGFFRGVFLAHYAPNLAEVSDEPEEVLQSWRKAAELVPPSDVLRALDLLSEALIRLREGREERLMTELALIKLTRPETASDPEALISRMDRLERRMGKPTEVPPLAPSVPQPTGDVTSPATGEEAATEELATAAAPLVSDGEEEQPEPGPPIDISFEQLQRIWPGLFGGLRDVLGARRWAFFREAVPAGVEGSTIILEVAHDFHLSSLEQDDAVAKIVATKASDLLGGPVRVRFRSKEAHPGGGKEVDLGGLEERPESDTDPTSLLASELGAEVVDD